MAVKICCTFPGRIGDILWSLPTVRMISRHFGVPVDFVVSEKYGDPGLLKLIGEQEYIHTAYSLCTWVVEEGAPMTPRVPQLVDDKNGFKEYDKVFHLGYKGWPKERNLAESIWKQALEEYAEIYFDLLVKMPDLDMSPWIKVEPFYSYLWEIYIGWSDEWIELKVGVTNALANTLEDIHMLVGAKEESRLQKEFDLRLDNLQPAMCNIYEAARSISCVKLYVGCLSSQWVLANALGKPCLVVEPAEARWHPVFWYEGSGEVKNVLVRGGDGKPTFDARHVKDAVEEMKKRIDESLGVEVRK